MKTELISRHHNNPPAGHFGIEKTQEYVAKKYHWKTLCHNVKIYVRGCDVCLASKTVKYKPYENLKQLSVPTHCWKDLSIDFIMRLPQSVDQRSNGYDSSLIIVNSLTKIAYYEHMQTTITIPVLAKVILNIIVRQYSLLNFIVSNCSSVFMFKLWSSLCYFWSIKRKLSTTFYPQTDGQTGRQNSIIEAYLKAFINYEQDNWARLLLIAEFVYNNAKLPSMGYTPFELNCRQHPCISYKEDINPRSRFKAADELTQKLRNLMVIYRKNLPHAQKMPKQAYDKGIKPKSYAFGRKIWLNSKYTKTKYNRKLEVKFFGPFRVLHLLGNQAYKLELPKQ